MSSRLLLRPRSMMLPDEITAIVEGLAERTKRKEIEWVSASSTGIPVASEEDFVASTPEYSVNVYRDAKNVVHFSILNRKGDVIYHVGFDDDESGYEEIDNLIDLAKRRASNVDEALDY